MGPGRFNALIDVAGIRVGHHTAIGQGFLTGTTVVLGPDQGMVAGPGFLVKMGLEQFTNEMR